jgi:putative drug exporter of the RND superfamily
VHHGEPRPAIERGFVASARVVTAAAVIMVAVFAAFIPEGDANIQPIAFGLAVGVAIDAFVVRMTLVPAVLALCGRGAWWLPRRLDRALPRFDVEGEELARELELADWPSEPAPLVATGLRVAGGPAEPVDLVAEAGKVLVLRGGTATQRRALLLGLGGRTPADGRVKVDGLLLPGRAGAVRRRSAYVRVDPRGDVAGALRAAAAPGVVVLLVDGLDDVLEPTGRAAVRRALADLLADGRRSVVVACRAGSALDDLLPVSTAAPVDLERAVPSAPAVV